MKTLRNILLVFCVLSIAFSSVLPASAAGTDNKDTQLTTRNDFVWGLNMHSNFYAVYGTVNLEEQVHLAAEMGCKILRNNFYVDDLYHVDTFVQLCNAYGIQVMLEYGGNIKGATDDAQRQEDYAMFKLIANRYNGKNGHGKIDYIQMENELDVYFAERVSSYGGSFGDGDTISQYPMEDLERVTRNLKNASAAIREADSNVRIVINAGWKHYGMFQYFQEQGLDYDILGWDWYTDMSSNLISHGQTAFGIYDTLNAKFHKPIMICETNIWTSSLPDENNPATWDGLVEICKDAYSKPNVIGCIIYQMCDQLNLETSGYEREAHFGFIYADKFGNMTGKKAAYDRFQYIFGGVAQPKVTIESLTKKAEEDPEETPVKPKKKTDKRPVSPVPHDDTPFDGSGLGQTEKDVSLDEKNLPDDKFDNVITPARIVHKGNPSQKFVWTLENTLTVIVGAVTLAFLGVTLVLFLRMRKKIATISES